MTDEERPDGTIDLTDIPEDLLVLGMIDTLEYEAKIDLEEAASWRRKVFELESSEEARELLYEFNKEMYERGIVRLDHRGNVRTPFSLQLFSREKTEE